MSWFVKAIGKPKAVAASLEAQFGYHTCPEPEETARQASKTAMLAILGAYPEDLLVVAHAYGSQNSPSPPCVGEVMVRVEVLSPLVVDPPET